MKKPTLLLTNRQNEVRLPLPLLRRRLEAGLRLLGPQALPPAVEITLVPRRTMARVHRDFLGDPTVTDVITFQHGEILVCPAVARTQARRFGTALRNEVLLYGLHGLLHLLGHTDDQPTAAAVMRREQESLLAEILRRERRTR